MSSKSIIKFFYSCMNTFNSFLRISCFNKPI
nr:MAG TPA: hypothetical protein [Crassvirales sp.]DAI34922.1 MAG TPA: hypothetical protein [Caudoviricetes sp.]